MQRLHTIREDFEALIRIYTADEGGRTFAPKNGIRWDFAYAEDKEPAQLYMIHPDFHGADGNSLPTDVQLPIGVEIPARMVVIVDEMRSEVHRNRIRPGVKFYCQEGARRVAEGIVTIVTGLHNDRPGAA